MYVGCIPLYILSYRMFTKTAVVKKVYHTFSGVEYCYLHEWPVLMNTQALLVARLCPYCIAGVHNFSNTKKHLQQGCTTSVSSRAMNLTGTKVVGRSGALDRI